MGDTRSCELAADVERKSLLYKTLYGGLFLVVLPLALYLWQRATAHAISLPTLRCYGIGWGLVILGLILLCSGMYRLWVSGKGLPMNAFPPEKFVVTGIYSLFPHPIYGGFIFVCAGFSLASGSSSGFWLVTPSVACACAALVLGYELPDLKKRFGTHSFDVWLPSKEQGKPSIADRLRVVTTVLTPWLLFYEAIAYSGIPGDAKASFLFGEASWPVLEWAEWIYASVYFLTAATPFLLVTKTHLRDFVVKGWVSMAIAFPLYLVVPFIAPPRAFVATTWAGNVLSWEHALSPQVVSFPSYHVIWAFLVAEALSSNRKAVWWVWQVWAVLVVFSCVAVGMHSVLDVLMGFFVYLVVRQAKRVWNILLSATEGLANSWKEWRVGPVRIINHGAYAGCAAGVAVWMISSLCNDRSGILSLSIFVGATIGAALWAQWVEGSPALLRPLGFYGGMIGATLGGMTAFFLRCNLWVALAAICVSAPWLQAIGRFRCLVQGCCHGRAADTVPGIHYRHPRSRVCRLSALAGIPVHPTPLYSILWNVLVGIFLLRLVQLKLPATLVGGVYLILSGCGRFVEEAYRGEPQTKSFGGLRFYQWIAVLCLVSGAVITAIPSPVMSIGAWFQPRLLLLSLSCALAGWFVSGVDFPNSSCRFARLT